MQVLGRLCPRKVFENKAIGLCEKKILLESHGAAKGTVVDTHTHCFGRGKVGSFRHEFEGKLCSYSTCD